jgi:hypothetical protein
MILNKIIIKHSTVKGKKPDPSDLALGEIALNTEDGVIYFKNKAGQIKEFRTIDQVAFQRPRSLLSKIIDIIYLLVTFIVSVILVFIVEVVLKLFV